MIENLFGKPKLLSARELRRRLREAERYVASRKNGSEQAILDDAKREMFGDDADLLPDDMGAK